MFTDEARFGRINRIRPCWAPGRIRPGVAAQLIREYIYLYGAVSPKDGTCVYLIMPSSNLECFQIFLEVLARKFARQDILLVLDGAPYHRRGRLAVPDNIRLLYLPPHSPELNPKENLWDEIRDLFQLLSPLSNHRSQLWLCPSSLVFLGGLRSPELRSPTHRQLFAVLC